MRSRVFETIRRNLLILCAVDEVHDYQQPVGVAEPVFPRFGLLGSDDFLQVIGRKGDTEDVAVAIEGAKKLRP